MGSLGYLVMQSSNLYSSLEVGTNQPYVPPGSTLINNKAEELSGECKGSLAYKRGCTDYLTARCNDVTPVINWIPHTLCALM